jgi:nitroreductase
MEFDDVLEKRKSIRNYSKKDVEMDEIMAICDSALKAPSAGNIPTLKIIIVKNEKTKMALAEAALEQDFIADAPYILVVCSDNSNLTRSYEEFGSIYSRQQAGAAIENMLLKITDLGLASCWIGAIDENAIKRILQIPDNITIEALLPIAQASQSARQAQKKKQDLKMVLFFEKWKQTTEVVERKVPA